MAWVIDLTGHRFSRLRVVQRCASRGRGAAWLCECDCGAMTEVAAIDLRKGDSQSCGCLARDRLVARNESHGMAGHLAYGVWKTMKSRCASDAQDSARYAGRGIIVCDRWRNSFEAFWEDMGLTWAKGLTLERVDNDKGYSPDNCVWADRFAQANNKSNNSWIETGLGRMTISQAARVFQVSNATLGYRMRAGWHPYDALAFG